MTRAAFCPCGLCARDSPPERYRFFPSFAGEMAEWLKAHAWKACLLERVTWVRIPLSPPFFKSQPDGCNYEIQTAERGLRVDVRIGTRELALATTVTLLELKHYNFGI